MDMRVRSVRDMCCFAGEGVASTTEEMMASAAVGSSRAGVAWVILIGVSISGVVGLSSRGCGLGGGGS